MGQFLYKRDGQQHGPVEGSEIRTLIEQGSLNAGDMVVSYGSDNWVRIDAVPALVPLLQRPPAPQPQQASAAALPRGEDRETFASLNILYWLVMLAGIGLMLWGAFSDKTVRADVLSEPVYNNGLLMQGLYAVVSGAAVFLVGAIGLAGLWILHSLSRINERR